MVIVGPTKPRSMAYPVLLALGAVDAAGYSVIGPVLPALAARLDAGPAVMGALVSAFPLASWWASPRQGDWCASEGCG